MTAAVEKNGYDTVAGMHLLWLSMGHPWGRMAGSSTYSAGLIEAATRAGAQVTLLTYGGGVQAPSVEVHSISQMRSSRWQSVLSSLPRSAWALAAPAMKQLVESKLAERRWAAMIVDHASMGWATPYALQARVPVVYIAHNHEASVRPAVAETIRPLWKRALVRWDAGKFSRLERWLAGEQAALITAITDTDANQFQRQTSSTPVLTLTPGYSSAAAALPPLPRDTPRRVIILSRYDWIAKQENLRRWASEGVPVLAAADIETAVAGHVPASLQQELARPDLTFWGEQSDLGKTLSLGRIGLVPEPLGGGFKMKTLDYIFHGLPIAALPDGLAGLPSEIQQSAIKAPTLALLAESITEAIDDIARLEHIRGVAFTQGQEAFDWQTRGEMLVSAIKEHCLRAQP